MNKRMKKKKTKYIIDNIQKFNLSSNEFLVIRYNKKDCRPVDIANFAEQVRNNVSSRILFVPTDWHMFKVCDNDLTNL